MELSWKARRRWSLFVLVVALPLYIIVAVTVITWFDRPPFLLELLIYIVLGILWAVPMKRVFRGIGQPDPEDSSKKE